MAPVIANDFKTSSYFCHRDCRKQCLEAMVAVRGKDRWESPSTTTFVNANGMRRWPKLGMTCGVRPRGAGDATGTPGPSGRRVSQREAPKATFSHIIETGNASYRHAQA